MHAAALKALTGMPTRSSSNARATGAGPTNSVIWHNYAATLGDLDRWPEALAAVNRAFACGLNAPETWLVSARAAEQRRSGRRRSRIQQAIKRRPDFAEAHRDCAQYLWMKTGDADAATERLRRAVAVHPDNTALVIVLANVLEFSGRPQAAYDELRQRLARTPGDVRLLLAAAHAAGLVGDDAAALDLAEAAQARAEALCIACMAVGGSARARCRPTAAGAGAPGRWPSR
jgi:predicted Zn-dependent protease